MIAKVELGSDATFEDADVLVGLFESEGFDVDPKPQYGRIEISYPHEED